MSVNQWFMLWVLFLSYLLLGAIIFYAIERRYEETRRVEDTPEKLEIEDLLDTYYTWTNNRAHSQLLLKLRQHCNVTVLRPMLKTEDVIEVEDEFQWTFYNSFFFALTTLSTIGYGNLHPTSCLGRMLVIVYSLVGIPLNGIVLTQLGDFFASTFLRVHQRYKGKHFETRFNLLVDIAAYLVPGILLFILLPSGFFVYFEGWTFEQSIYFAFVTLTTVGYGDYVAGQSTTDALWYHVYKTVLILWIMFGLGYLVMILGFISRAMRCKKMARLERKLAQNLKYTHSKILNEFNRDVSYVRRLLNELYLLKYKPVYQNEKEEPSPIEPKRTRSAPCLSEWPVLAKMPTPVYSSSEDEEETKMMFEKQRMKRRKALSENLYKHQNLRTRSESDLIRIDKEATFDDFAYVERNELIARVSDAFQRTYSQIQAQTMDSTGSNEEESFLRKVSQFEKELRGINGFSNDEILATERNVNSAEYTYTGQLTWPPSENTIDRNKLRLPEIPVLREKRRSIPLPGVQSLRRMSMAAINFLTTSKFGKTAATKDDDAIKDLESAGPKDRRPERVRKERYSLCEDCENMYDCLNYYTQIRMKEANIFSALRNEIGELGRASPVFEQTSIGDVLRIVTSLGINEQDDKTSTKKQNNSSPLFTLFQNTSSPDEPNRQGKNCTDRRYSLIPPQTKQAANVIRNKSFCSQSGRASPSRYSDYRERSASNQMPQIRRIRSEFLPSVLSDDAAARISSRRIKRFLVKPVTLPASTPSIVVSGPRLEENAEGIRRRSVCDNDETQHSKL